jgi:hypothetical protein
LELPVQPFLLVSQLLISGSKSEFSLLVAFKEGTAFCEILPEASILEQKIIDLCLVAI